MFTNMVSGTECLIVSRVLNSVDQMIDRHINKPHQFPDQMAATVAKLQYVGTRTPEALHRHYTDPAACRRSFEGVQIQM